MRAPCSRFLRLGREDRPVPHRGRRGRLADASVAIVVRRRLRDHDGTDARCTADRGTADRSRGRTHARGTGGDGDGPHELSARGHVRPRCRNGVHSVLRTASLEAPLLRSHPRHNCGVSTPRAARGATAEHIAGEALYLAGGARALLLQIAHPAVGRGVVEHSDFASRLMDRFDGTMLYLTASMFGTPEELRAMRRIVNRAHAPVRGDAADASTTG